MRSMRGFDDAPQFNEVRAQSGKKIPTADADGLLADAEQIKQAIGC